MLYMKEMRAKVVAECTLKESAAINQILGRRVGNSSGLYLRMSGLWMWYAMFTNSGKVTGYNMHPK